MLDFFLRKKCSFLMVSSLISLLYIDTQNPTDPFFVFFGGVDLHHRFMGSNLPKYGAPFGF